VIFQFCLFVSSVSSFFFRLSFHFRFSCEFSFVETVPAITGWLEQHALAPKFRAEVAVYLRPIFLSFSFFFFLLPFSFNSSILLHSFGNRTAKLVPFPFHSRDLPERYLLLFLSPTFFLCSCVSNL
jgi:hypothetical protein